MREITVDAPDLLCPPRLVRPHAVGPHRWEAVLTREAGEHIVSEGLWHTTSATVTGLSWCIDEPKTVGISSLTAKILCKSHNSALSPVDIAGKATSDVLDEARNLFNERCRRQPKAWDMTQLYIDGLMLERWFLKTAINVANWRSTSDLWQIDSAPFDRPGERLVRLAFGLDKFVSPMGLYFATSKGEEFAFADALGVAPHRDAANRVIGFLLEFWSLRFVLWLSDDVPPTTLDLGTSQKAAWRQSDLRYRIGKLSWSIDQSPSHEININWS